MAKTKSNIKAICDAGPVIHLDELNCLDLLCDFQEIILADTVSFHLMLEKQRPLL